MVLAKPVILKDIGVIGLASHDMFAWDRESERNTENGRLDLSTIFDYAQGNRWKRGGDPKNSENAPVHTVTMNLVKLYKKSLKKNGNDYLGRIKSRRETVAKFHELVKESYKRLSGLSFPKFGRNEDVTNTEQAVMRALHDILPGKIKTYRALWFPFKEIKLTNFLFAKLNLNQKEMNQKIAYYDGEYDKEYTEIKIPFTRKTINLKEIDKKFIERYSSYRQKEMLNKLSKVGEGNLAIHEVSFIFHLKELFSKGICSWGNAWMPIVPCI